MKRFPIVFSTTHSLARTSGNNYLYDYVIIDESSQVDLASATIAMSCAKNIVLVGDLKQLPHVVKSKDKKPLKNIFSKYKLPEYFEYTENSILKSVSTLYGNKIPNTLLNEHYRCDPEIIGFCNKRFYNNELIIQTQHESNNGIEVIYTEPFHARGRTNERQIDIIKDEILPNLTNQEIGIITPFRDQVNKLKNSSISHEYLMDTIHKFQGKERNNIIISTVVNKVKIFQDEDTIDFLNNQNLLNVAISRAKNKLYLIMSEALMKQDGTILSDLIKYIQYSCSDSVIKKTKIYSVMDLMYEDYSSELIEFQKKMLKISDFNSENIIATLIEKICKEMMSGSFNFLPNYPLRKLVRPSTIFNNNDKKFLLNSGTHCDFVIFNKLDKSVSQVVEVDGVQHENPIQKKRDEMKDRLLKNAGIPILRIKTTSSNCEKRIIEALNNVQNNTNKIYI